MAAARCAGAQVAKRDVVISMTSGGERHVIHQSQPVFYLTAGVRGLGSIDSAPNLLRSGAGV